MAFAHPGNYIEFDKYPYSCFAQMLALNLGSDGCSGSFWVGRHANHQDWHLPGEGGRLSGIDRGCMHIEVGSSF